LQHHVYVLSRYGAEESSSFERTFLHTHLDYHYRLLHDDHKTGFLGIDYTYLDEYKRSNLNLTERGGLFVREVHPGSSAIQQGLLFGDYITAIDGMPISRHNRLSKLLKGRPAGSTVEVTLWRKSRPARPIGDARSAGDYREIVVEVRLEEYEKLIRSRRPKTALARLGCEWVCNAISHGVVCRVGGGLSTVHGICDSHGRYFDTPDVRMLKIVMEELTPGESVTLEPGGVELDLGIACGRKRRALLAPSAMDPADIERLRKAHPGYFAAPSPSACRYDDRSATVLAFDRRFALLMKYRSTTETRGTSVPIDDAYAFATWNDIESGPVHVYVGVCSQWPGSGMVRFTEGEFLSFDHDRVRALADVDAHPAPTVDTAARSG
jgi:hypothetical protein